MNIIQIDSGSKNDHIYLPFINAQPNQIHGKRYLYIHKAFSYMDYIVGECVNNGMDNIELKPIFGKRVNFKNNL